MIKIKRESGKIIDSKKKSTKDPAKDLSLMTRLLNSYVKQPEGNFQMEPRLTDGLMGDLLNKDVNYLKDSILKSKGLIQYAQVYS